MTETMPSAAAQPLAFAAADQAEELARAELYGVLARLWLAPPDAALLAQYRSAVTESAPPGAVLDAPWAALVAALRDSTPQSAGDEFDALFQGVGKPDVLAYGSYHQTGFLNEQPLATLRADLARLGLARDESRVETEDHIAYGFEVMRWLIAGDDPALCNLAEQQRFFRRHMQPWVGRLCEAVQTHPRARLWRALAAMTAAFIAVETQGFDLLE